MIAFIADRRAAQGGAPICEDLPIAPSTCRAQAALPPGIARVLEKDVGVHGARKVWRRLERAGHGVACGTVARPLCAMGLQGVIRARPARATTGDAWPAGSRQSAVQGTRPNALRCCGRRIRASCWMRCGRPCMSGALGAKEAWGTTATGAANTSPSSTPAA
jgi:putative transposase